jgi:hypothetical protein
MVNGGLMGSSVNIYSVNFRCRDRMPVTVSFPVSRVVLTILGRISALAELLHTDSVLAVLRPGARVVLAFAITLFD